MTNEQAEIGEFELMAYVDGQLDLRQALEVEAFLAERPELAARVMADAHTRDALRAQSFEQSTASSERTVAAVQNLQRRFDWRRRLQLSSAAAAVLAAAGGGLAYTQLTESSVHTAQVLPSIVDDALQAHLASGIRAKLASQIEHAPTDLTELRAAAGIALPRPLSGWRLRDAQLFPSDDGPGVHLAYDPPGAVPVLSVFAVRTQDQVPITPTAVRRGAKEVVYWRSGETALAVTGPTGAALSGLARQLTGSSGQ